MNFKDHFAEMYLEGHANALNFLLDPANKDKFIYDLEQEFIDNGGEVLGTGAGGTAYTHPSWNYILKTFSGDYCYLRFARFAANNQRPSYPRFIGGVQKVIPHFARHWSQENIYLIRMEKLTPIDRADELYHQFKMLMREVITAHSIKNANNDILSIQDLHSIVMKYYDTDNFGFEEYGKNVMEAIKGFYEFFKNPKVMNNCRLDLHSANVMTRPSTGQLVITDPLYNSTPLHKNDFPTNHKNSSENMYAMSSDKNERKRLDDFGDAIISGGSKATKNQKTSRPKIWYKSVSPP